MSALRCHIEEHTGVAVYRLRLWADQGRTSTLVWPGPAAVVFADAEGRPVRWQGEDRHRVWAAEALATAAEDGPQARAYSEATRRRVAAMRERALQCWGTLGARAIQLARRVSRQQLPRGGAAQAPGRSSCAVSAPCVLQGTCAAPRQGEFAAQRRLLLEQQRSWAAELQEQRALGVEVDETARGVDRAAAAYPLVRPAAERTRGARENDTVSADEAWLRRKAVPPVQWAPPRTERIPLDEPVLWPEGKQCPYPHELPGLGREGLWLQVEEWGRAYRAEWAKWAFGQRPGNRRHRFDYSKIPGGKRGLVLEDFLHEDFKGIVWDLREWIVAGAVRGKGPRCRPLQAVPAQRNSDWKLAELRAAAEGLAYTDKDIMAQLFESGLRSFSSELLANRTVLVPNYKGFWQPGCPGFVAGKCKEDREFFKTPRLEGGAILPAFLNARVHPRNCNVKTSAETGAVKRRLTTDDAAPRPPHGRKWEPGESVAWNDGVPLEDTDVFPQIGLASVDSYAKGLAVLGTAGVPVGQYKTDLRGYYRMLPRYWREVGAGQQWTTLEHCIEVDWRLQCAGRGGLIRFAADRTRIGTCWGLGAQCHCFWKAYRGPHLTRGRLTEKQN